MNNRISIKKAAELLNCTEQTVRKGLQQGSLKIGYAIKTSDQWTYIITRQKFEQETGITIGE